MLPDEAASTRVYEDIDVDLFTDTSYGHEQGFKRSSLLPGWVEDFAPKAGEVRVMASGYMKSTGPSWTKVRGIPSTMPVT